MLDVEYAQLSHPSHGDANRCFASIVPKTEEQRRTHGWLFALADELGDEKQSHNSSKFILESISSAFRSASPYELHRALLPRLIQQANAKLIQTSSKSAAQIAFMTCAFRSDCAVVCHVGDVRCYLVRRGHAELLTRDHTAANDFRRLGLAPSHAMSRSCARQILARSLGTDTFVAVDVTERQISAGDVLLACSYGFYSALPDIDMELIISDNRDLNVAVRELVSAAAKSKVLANATSVQIMRIDEIENERKNS